MQKTEEILRREVDRLRAIVADLKPMETLLKGLESDSPTLFARAYHKCYSDNRPEFIAKLEGLAKSLDSEKSSYQSKLHKFQSAFGRSFPEECKKSGLEPITGNEIKGFQIKHVFTVKLNWVKANARIETVNKGYRRTVNSVNMSKIIESLMKLNKQLYERSFSPEEFIEKLYDAYEKIAPSPAADVLLTEIGARLKIDVDELAIDIGKLLASNLRTTTRGLLINFSSGQEGIVVYRSSGQFQTYKFLRFREGNSL